MRAQELVHEGFNTTYYLAAWEVNLQWIESLAVSLVLSYTLDWILQLRLVAQYDSSNQEDLLWRDSSRVVFMSNAVSSDADQQGRVQHVLWPSCPTINQH